VTTDDSEDPSGCARMSREPYLLQYELNASRNQSNCLDQMLTVINFDIRQVQTYTYLIMGGLRVILFAGVAFSRELVNHSGYGLFSF
jgi:hypothetical protein